MKKSDYRKIAQSILKDRGFDVRVSPGQGYLPGTRLTAARAGIETNVAVKASQRRAVSFTKQSAERWRTLHTVGLVIAVVPGLQDPDAVDVLGFERKPLIRKFDRAWQALKLAKHPAGFTLPVFVPIDGVSPKRLGHNIGNLKEIALWTVHLSREQAEQRCAGVEESYVDAFRRRFAAENGVDMNRVIVSITGEPK